jgi:hypothetical protein
MRDNSYSYLRAHPENVEKVKPYTTGVYVGWSPPPLLPLLTSIPRMGRGIIDLSGEPVSKALLLKVIGNSYILNMVRI